MDEFCGNAGILDFRTDFFSCESGDETEGGVWYSKTVQNGRNVESLSAGEDLFRSGTVGFSGLEVIDGHDVIQRWV